MSASRSPTDAPARANARARLTLTVDFPTPPFPEPIATTFATSGIRSPSVSMLRRTLAPIFRWTAPTPGTCASASLTSFSIWAFRGHPVVVRLTVKDTRSPSILRSSIIPSETMSTCSSGSFTPLRASRTFACSTIPVLKSVLLLVRRGCAARRRQRRGGGRLLAARPWPRQTREVAGHVPDAQDEDAERVAHPPGKDQLLQRLPLPDRPDRVGTRAPGLRRASRRHGQKVQGPEGEEEARLCGQAEAPRTPGLRGAAERGEIEVCSQVLVPRPLQKLLVDAVVVVRQESAASALRSVQVPRLVAV